MFFRHPHTPDVKVPESRESFKRRKVCYLRFGQYECLEVREALQRYEVRHLCSGKLEFLEGGEAFKRRQVCHQRGVEVE